MMCPIMMTQKHDHVGRERQTPDSSGIVNILSIIELIIVIDVLAVVIVVTITYSKVFVRFVICVTILSMALWWAEDESGIVFC